jgi:AraC family transcriptional regulator
MSAFHGVEVEAREVGGLRYRTSVFAPGSATQPHAHETAYFCLVLEGHSDQRAGRIERSRECGRAYFYPSGEVHSERFGRQGSRLFSVEIGGAALADTGLERRLPGASLELAGLAALMLRRVHLEAYEGDGLGIENQALALIGVLAGESCDHLRWAPIVRDYLHSHFREKVTLRELALAAGLHPVHLCRAFPRRFGVTVGKYLRALRADHAARLLRKTDRSVAEIALEAGFSSQPHLTRELKRLLGTTPAAYRQR